jgi:uncharacterized protein
MPLPVRMMLRISSGSNRTAVISRYLDGWKLSVGAVPERGNANEEIVRLLADVLAIPKSQIAIVAGPLCADEDRRGRRAHARCGRRSARSSMRRGSLAAHPYLVLIG